MLKNLAFIFILSSNIVLAQTSSEVNIDKTSETINQQSTQNIVIVVPISVSPYNNSVITSQKSVVTSNTDSSNNSNVIHTQPINVISIDQVSTKSNKSISVSSTNTEIEKHNIIVVPTINIEEYNGQNSKKSIEQITNKP